MTERTLAEAFQHQVLILLPDEVEFQWTHAVLQEAKIPFQRCQSISDFVDMAPHRFGAALFTEEILDAETSGVVEDLLYAQEPWSDLPLLLITKDPDQRAQIQNLRQLPQRGNLTLLQRPLQALTLASSLQFALRARQRQYQIRELLVQRHSVLASINDSFVMVNRDWRFVYVNQKAADIYGVRKQELLGQLIWQAIPDLAKPPHFRQLQDAAENQQELQTEFFHAPSERWFEQRIYPSQAGVSIFSSDITERKQAEEQLRYQLSITQAITDNAADSFFLLDPDGKVTFMNPAAEKTFGWKKEELIGQCLHDHIHYHKSQPAKCNCPLRSVFTSGLTLRDLEDQFYCKNGSRLNVSCSNAAIIIDHEPAGSVLVVHDITYHKLAEQQLKALNENLEIRVAERAAIAEHRASQLSALAAELTQTEHRERRRLAHILHDNLQQILVATKLQVSMLRGRMTDDVHRSDMLQIEDLLNRSIDESRTLTVELSPPILYDAGLGRAAEWLARRMQKEHGLAVTLEADPLAEPKGDDIRAFLFQAVREALFNIVKHAGVHEASVTISLNEAGDSVIKIRDHGHGFELEPAQSQGRDCGGFGLFSIRERLEFLGGKMVITSAPNHGTCIALYVPRREPTAELPLNIEPDPFATTAALPTVRRDRSHAIRVLLADDHKMLRDGLAGLLRGVSDIEVVSQASDGEMALKLAHETNPHVVIMDVTMPHMNGIDATRRLTAELPQIKVIALSMHEREEMAEAMREAGAVSYITKGAPAEILTAAIRNCMKIAGDGAPPPTLSVLPSALPPSEKNWQTDQSILP
jgi:PAS domain S-box-containing protein